ncbi:YlmC/YmxH family sporulation protein [Anaeromicrobium sediminis]|uniref:PRC-barrel domain-containing protein n=1 Tax=Anaeromicrobium sediminis TaxID=1478221 RepID=A0A267MIT4_9FIRM|nr:YlmC/YmxH family sporulation protein [Anaeromicrobium sediminis]PAB58838.1 hypothetical protein CCE28_13160 [Anaeromicrobium sediminis]
MISTGELREKEIINVSDGKKLGFVSDIEINLEKGRVVSVIVPTEGRFLGIFGKYNEYVIPWREINKIGVDVVLVNSKSVVETNKDKVEEYEEEYEEMPVEKEIFIKKEGNI